MEIFDVELGPDVVSPERTEEKNRSKKSTAKIKRSSPHDETLRTFSAVAMLIAAEAHDQLAKALNKRSDPRLPDPQVVGRVADELAEAFQTRRMGRRELAHMAYRRLSEEVLRSSIPKYSVALEQSGKTPLKYFDEAYRSLFNRLGLGVGSVVAVDANLTKYLHRRGQLKLLGHARS